MVIGCFAPLLECNLKAAKDFAFGFVMAICIAAGIAFLLGALLIGFQSPSSLKQAVLVALAATSFMLVYAGGEIAFSFLFASEAPIGIKFMHFLGAVCAVVVAFFVTPLSLDALEGSKAEKCRTVVEADIGPFKFSREDCDD